MARQRSSYPVALHQRRGLHGRRRRNPDVSATAVVLPATIGFLLGLARLDAALPGAWPEGTRQLAGAVLIPAAAGSSVGYFVDKASRSAGAARNFDAILVGGLAAIAGMATGSAMAALSERPLLPGVPGV